MKKLLMMALALAMLLTLPALADEADGVKVDTLIEDGEFIIQLDVSDGDLGWIADDMEQDPSVVELAFCDIVEGTFVARYAPVGDGDMTVGVKHYIGIACDEAFTWDIHVEGGAVTDVTGGSHAMRSDGSDIDPYMVGEWLESETQFTQMTIEKNPEYGWDVDILSPMTHGAYEFKTTIYYDCDRDCFVYDKGKFWDLPITDSDEEVELGEAAVAGTTGSFTFVGDEQSPMLEWHDDVQNPEGSILLERVDAMAEVPTEDMIYSHPDCDLTFSYDPAAFIIAMDDHTDDEDLVVLDLANEAWGEGYVRICLHEMEDGEAFMTEEDIANIETSGVTVTKLDEWGGFTDVYNYSFADEEAVEIYYIAPVYDDDGEIEDSLTVIVSVAPLDDDETEIARDDAISAVIDSLQVVDD